MNADDLFDMLDLGGKEKPLPASAGPVIAPGRPGQGGAKDGRETAPPSPTVLAVDEWDVDKGEYLKKSVPQYDFPSGGEFVSEEAWTDFFSAAYQSSPEMTPNPADTRRAEYLKSVMETTDYQSLRTSTTLNELASEMAGVQFAREWAKLKEKDHKRGSKPAKTKKEAEKQAAQADRDLLGAAGAALAGAAEAVGELEDVAHGLGAGEPGKPLDPRKVAELYKKVRHNAALKRICELAGRFRRLAQTKQRMKTTHGYDDMIGVEMAGDVGRLLPVELGKIADPDLELDTLRRLVERQTMCREYRGSEPAGKGPIIVCVDESGSMRGEPVAHAKAFALALAWIAKRQNRWCALVGYAGGTSGTRVALPPGGWDQLALTEWLTHFYGGGTVMDVPLRELPTTYWNELKCPRGKTDVILITDAIVSVESKMEEEFNAWKKREQVKCISLVIGTRAGDLEKVSDEVHLIGKIDVDVEAVGRTLSL